MIGNNSNQNHPALILGTFAFTSTEAPKPVAAAHARLTKLSKATLGASRDELGDAVAAAILADRDPAGDPKVQRAIAATYIDNPGMTQHLENLAVQGFREACSRHHEAIVTLWQEPYDTAAAALSEAHARLGGVSLYDTVAILGLGADAAEVWAQAQKEHRKLDRIAQGWGALMAFMGVELDRRYITLRTVDVDADTWVTRNLSGEHLDPWAALSADLALALPTLDEYRARVAAAQAAASGAVAPPVDRLRVGNAEWAARTGATAGALRITI